MPLKTAKALYTTADRKARQIANLPARRNDPGDIPLGNGMAGQAKKAITGRQRQLDKAIRDAGG